MSTLDKLQEHNKKQQKRKTDKLEFIKRYHDKYTFHELKEKLKVREGTLSTYHRELGLKINRESISRWGAIKMFDLWLDSTIQKVLNEFDYSTTFIFITLQRQMDVFDPKHSRSKKVVRLRRDGLNDKQIFFALDKQLYKERLKYLEA